MPIVEEKESTIVTKTYTITLNETEAQLMLDVCGYITGRDHEFGRGMFSGRTTSIASQLKRYGFNYETTYNRARGEIHLL